jgi:hypothetical protein
VIRTQSNVLTSTHRRTTLTNKDISGEHELSAKALDAQTLGVGITPVLGATTGLFMCHLCYPSKAALLAQP